MGKTMAIEKFLRMHHPSCDPREGDGAYGFQLRNDDYLPGRQAMFSLLRDAFVNDLTVITDYQIDPGKINGIAIRVALIRSLIPSKAQVPRGRHVTNPIGD